MKEFKVQHIHCGVIRTIYGDDIFVAFRKAGLSSKVWAVV
jgi:hypothetical protein